MSRRRRRRQEKKIREQKTEPYWCGVCHEEHEDGKEGVKCGKCGRMSHCVETYAKWQKCCVCSAKIWRKRNRAEVWDPIDDLVERHKRASYLEIMIIYGFVILMVFVSWSLQPNRERDMSTCTEERPCAEIGIMTLKLPVYSKPEVINCGESWTAESMPMGSWAEGMWKLRSEE